MLPSPINAFLIEHHVVGLATVSAGEPWAASCFYAFDESSQALVILSSAETRHGLAMLDHGVVAGSIASQPTSIRAIRGIQFVADAALLQSDAADDAYRFYCSRHPIARLRRSAVWRLALRELKYTDNAKLFGTKLCWRRDESR
jgi:uncharacterized protein YhbP (UPF0306 family)